MQKQFWKQGLVLSAKGFGETRVKIACTRDAAIFLAKRWPSARTACYYRAVLTCTRALRGEVADDYVQSIFSVAVIEARFSIEYFDPFWDHFENEISMVTLELMQAGDADMPVHLAAAAETLPQHSMH